VNLFPCTDESRLTRLDIAAAGLLIALSSLSIWSLILAQIHNFHLPLLGLGCVGVGIVILLLGKRFIFILSFAHQSIGEHATVLLVLVCSTLLLAHPAEYTVGGGDAGVYVNWGVDIARTGSLLPRDPITAELPPEQLDGFLRRQPPNAETDYLRFPGFYLSETDQGLLIPQFFPLQSIWMAIAYAIAGIDGVLLMTPLWGVLGVLAFYLFARCFLPWPMAILAAVLLAVNPLQVYFSRYPTAEALTQYLMWTALWSFTCYISRTSLRPLWGLTAALSLGMVALARIDALPVIALPAAWALYLTLFGKWRRSELWFWGVYGIVSGYALFHALWFAYPYMYNTYSSIIPLLLRAGLPLIVAGFLLLGIVLLAQVLLRKQQPRSFSWEGISRNAQFAGVALVVLLALYAYFVRPILGNSTIMNYWYAQTQVPQSNHENLVRFGWYFTPLGIALATAGACVAILRGRWRLLWPWVLVGGIFTLLYFYNILNNPIQIYAMRRYVPVVLPTFVLAAVFFLTWLWNQQRHPRVMRTLASLLLFAWLAGLFNSGRLILPQVEYAGVTDQIEALAAQFPDNALLLFVDPAPVGLGVVLGTPLHFLYDRPSYDLQEEFLTEATLLAQISQWQENGYALFMLVTPGAELPLAASHLTHVAPLQVTYPFLEQSYEHAPQYVQQIDLKLDIYEIAPSPP
jgi:hypothetical protein